MAKDTIYEEFGISEKDWTKLALECEHIAVDAKLQVITEKEAIQKLFPKIEPLTQLKILYWARLSWWAGYRNKDP